MASTSKSSTSSKYDYRSLARGFKFSPSDEQLLTHYLWRKTRGLQLDSDAVVEMDVYSREPWLLPWDENSYMKDDERYYFVRRERLHDGKGNRPKRSLEGDIDGGWWKASTGDKRIPDIENPVGYVKALSFYTYKNENRDRKDGISTNWTIYEYKLATDTFQEWVLCKVKNNNKVPDQEKKRKMIRLIKYDDEEEEKEKDEEETTMLE
ncbi:NAM domain-containing protein [Cephalotus follicularis]|uniref:NAM domain-containing protein n=1 Tax=Cephalotus follicularis TaxID=3775 RepID=A0A1Q3CJP3_CEPFO|nr:NAM domain-containing protein [Cephalotus follicularis]